MLATTHKRMMEIRNIVFNIINNELAYEVIKVDNLYSQGRFFLRYKNSEKKESFLSLKFINHNRFILSFSDCNSKTGYTDIIDLRGKKELILEEGDDVKNSLLAILMEGLMGGLL